MRKWTVLFAVLAVALAVPAGFGQQPTGDELLERIKALEGKVESLQKENAELRGLAEQNIQVDDEALEAQINALADRYAAGATVNSEANPITLTGELRLRNTWYLGDQDTTLAAAEGGAADDERDGSWTDALVRLGFEYEFTRDVSAFVELQTHWVYGDDGSATFGQHSSPFSSPFGFFPGPAHGESSNDVQLHQAYIELRNVFDQPQFRSISGRQEIVLGNQFQFGNADWYSGWSFDGTRWIWEEESFVVNAIVAKLSSVDRDLNQVPSYLLAHDDDELYAVYFTLKTIENHELDLYWIYVNGHGVVNSVSSLGHNLGGAIFGTNAYYHTLGGRIGGMVDVVAAGLDWNAELAFQFGDANGTMVDDVSGLAFEGEAGITLNEENRFRVFARGLWAQGPDNDETGYVPLYPNRHTYANSGGFRARYGIMDLIPMTNVFSLQGGVHFDPTQEWTLGATALWATTDEEVTSDDAYGWELDFWGEYRYSENLHFGGGLGILFPEDEGVALWGIDDDTHFLLYLQARLFF